METTQIQKENKKTSKFLASLLVAGIITSCSVSQTKDVHKPFYGNISRATKHEMDIYDMNCIRNKEFCRSGVVEIVGVDFELGLDKDKKDTVSPVYGSKYNVNHPLHPLNPNNMKNERPGLYLLFSKTLEKYNEGHPNSKMTLSELILQYIQLDMIEVKENI